MFWKIIFHNSYKKINSISSPFFFSGVKLILFSDVSVSLDNAVEVEMHFAFLWLILGFDPVTTSTTVHYMSSLISERLHMGKKYVPMKTQGIWSGINHRWKHMNPECFLYNAGG